ncbi:hypothetical protein Vadar_022158 [Vaccinium darrowii]|uniref:Uncharacterized protein n=1 Tax=Vaccinium darrowii TaxID=229202 RepID=A0ACB7YXJ1_9ERIC|nr:hypothetical protein Vadar_022158 [Vaccinium darrowii]
MDVGSWCNSGHIHAGYSRTFLASNLPVSSGSKVPIWRLLWRRIKKVKKIFFIHTSSTNQNFSYNPYTYAQNFDEGLMLENLDDLSRSFSARFAVPSRIFQKSGGLIDSDTF